MIVPMSLVLWGLELRLMLVVLDSQGFGDYGTAAGAANFGRHAGCAKLARRH